MAEPKFVNKAMSVSDGSEFDIVSSGDGTTTVAQMYIRGHLVATGVAKRMRRDKKNKDLGTCLAMYRMFLKAAKMYSDAAEELLDPPKPPGADAEKAMLRARKEKAHGVKDTRRKAAREAYELAKDADPDAFDFTNPV